MRLTIAVSPERHTEACTALSVSLSGEILTGGDDFSVWRWNANGEPIARVVELDSCVTVVTWLSAAGTKGRGAGGKDTCVVACADGTMRFTNVTAGRVEKVVEAHTGAITALVFNPDGSAIVTGGEDGVLKVWSQAGMQRSVLANVGKCVYALVWGGDIAEFQGDCVLYASGTDVTVKPLNPAVKRQLRWKAHGGVVLCVDWSRMSNVIVTGGEDGTYKAWDPYGHNIYTSSPGDSPVTSIAFGPDGELFAVGSFQTLRVCDKTGWTHAVESTTTGSVMAMQWTADGTQIVLGGGTGGVAMAQLVDRKVHWSHYTVSLHDSKKLLIQDVQRETVEELDHRDKISKMDMGYGYLVVCTTTQCIVYDVSRWGAPTQFDLRDAVITVALAERGFLLADCATGVQVFTYEGRPVCTVRLAATIKPEYISRYLLSMSLETIAARDPADGRKVLFFDVTTGKALKDLTLVHHLEIHELALAQGGTARDRKIAFIDRNRDLYLACVYQKLHTPKIATMVSSLKWHTTYEILIAIADGRLVAWFLPTAYFADRDLIARSRVVKEELEELARNDQLQDFSSSRVSVRRGKDGALLTVGLSPYPSLLLSHVTRHDWDAAIRLCRFINDSVLWAMLTTLAVQEGELNAAELGYAAMDDVDKVRYMRWLRDIPSPEGRAAELALFTHRPEEAERVLLQANLIYRTIDMHMRLGHWERALNVAVERRTHVDTVLARRQRYLETIGRQESLEKFKQLAGSVTIDWPTIEEKVKQEDAKEKQRPGSKPYGAK